MPFLNETFSITANVSHIEMKFRHLIRMRDFNNTLLSQVLRVMEHGTDGTDHPVEGGCTTWIA